MLGLRIDREASEDGRGLRLPAAHERAMDALLDAREDSRWRVAWIGGPSGAGKSRMLRAMADRLGAQGVSAKARALAGSDRAIVDLMPGSTGEAVRDLARGGLADPALLGRQPRELSTGEMARFSLALAMAKARRVAQRTGGATLLVDEFGSTLDPALARNLGLALRRWVVRFGEGVLCVCASACPQAREALAPDVSITLDSRDGARVRWESGADNTAGGAGICDWVRIEPGDTGDFIALAQHHYRGGLPATVCAAIRAVDLTTGEIVGVMLTSRPTLNSRVRELAWPGRYRTGDAKRDAARINRELRCISRVVTAPSHRGLGIARLLVRRYLDAPETVCTEAVSAIGASAPMLRAAGMTEYHLATPMRDLRLLDAMACEGLTPGAILAGEGAGRCAPGELVTRELRRWAMAERSTRRYVRLAPEGLALVAARRLGATRVGYAHTAQGGVDDEIEVGESQDRIA